MPRRYVWAGACRRLSRRRSPGISSSRRRLGCLPAVGTFYPRIGIACFAILAATHWARRIADPGRRQRRRVAFNVSGDGRPHRHTGHLRVWSSACVQRMAGPSWAGLVSTFPSMSLVVLAVTHLEAGPAEASRIAKVLPAGNTSTLGLPGGFSPGEPSDRPGRRDDRRLRGCPLRPAHHRRIRTTTRVLSCQFHRGEIDLAVPQYVMEDRRTVPAPMGGLPRRISFSARPAALDSQKARATQRICTLV